MGSLGKERRKRMITTLEERLEKRLKDYEEFVQREKEVYPLYAEINRVFPDLCNLSIYSYGASILAWPKLAREEVEILLDTISDEFKLVWKRVVTKDEMRLESIYFVESYKIELRIYPKTLGTCRKVATPTGKMVKEHKFVEFEVPEMSYIIQCDEEIHK